MLMPPGRIVNVSWRPQEILRYRYLPEQYVSIIIHSTILTQNIGIKMKGQNGPRQYCMSSDVRVTEREAVKSNTYFLLGSLNYVFYMYKCQ